MSIILPALLIFLLRVTDVSIGTVRVIFAVRGRRGVAALLGLFEAGIFIAAISTIFKGDTMDPMKMGAYAFGFAAGNYLGITLEGWIASGTLLVRAISRTACPQLLNALHDAGFGATATQGAGRQGEVHLYFVVAPRKRERELLALIERHDPEAFVTVEAVNHTMGGYLTGTPAGAVRK